MSVSFISLISRIFRNENRNWRACSKWTGRKKRDLSWNRTQKKTYIEKEKKKYKHSRTYTMKGQWRCEMYEIALFHIESEGIYAKMRVNTIFHRFIPCHFHIYTHTHQRTLHFIPMMPACLLMFAIYNQTIHGMNIEFFSFVASHLTRSYPYSLSLPVLLSHSMI